MPLFTRRRIQAMLDELGPIMERGKAKDMLARLGRTRQPDQVLAAEMELGLLWAMRQVGHVEVEPKAADGRRPDSASNDLLGNVPAIIEITTVSDAHFSGEKLMRRAFFKIADFAHTVCRDAKYELSMLFGEEGHWDQGKCRRVRRVTENFELDDAMREQLRAWLRGPKSQALRLVSADIDVAITWQAGRKIRTAEYWSTLPPLAYDIRTNPVHRALTDRRKRKQLRHSPNGTLRCIFIADGGCELLRNMDRLDALRSTYSGRAVIEHGMKQAKIDIVCVFTPKRQTDFMRSWPDRRVAWEVNVVAAPELMTRLDFSRIEALVEKLPRPRFEGYQARSIQEQGNFVPDALGWHLGTTATWRQIQGRDNVTLKISARALQEFLAGRLSREQFENQFGDNGPNLFEQFLKQGYTLSASKLEPAGLDEDDDHIVFEFAQDAAASSFRIDTGDGKTMTTSTGHNPPPGLERPV